MALVPAHADSDVERYLEARQRRELLRFLACGSVDDGKSTLIGRLLHESGTVLDDQLEALVADSRKLGARGGEIDYALVLDGLNAEREQRITIDVAYRYFSTERRKFIVADTPGHEQYTRNMVSGASTAGLAIVLVDARKGVLPQTRRHSYIVSLLGIPHVVLAVNKMDLVEYSPDVFARIEADYRELAGKIGLRDFVAIPICAVQGDNILAPSRNTPWYPGPSLMEHLETVPVDDDLPSRPFRMPVQWVNRPDTDFRGFAGTIVSGTLQRGDAVRVLPSGRESRIARIVAGLGDAPDAVCNQSITLTLEDEIDVSRGDVIVAADDPVEVSSQFEAAVVWMGNAPMLPGRNYLMKIGTRTVTATVAPLKHKVDVHTLAPMVATKLELNEIGVCQLELDQPVPFEPYSLNRDLGGFILIDRMTNETVGAGMLRFSLRRARNVRWQATDLDRFARAALKGQKPCVLWFTGIPAAGKSTIANLVEGRLHAMGRHTYLLDGDNVRHGLNKDLGFSEGARVENIRRVAEVARLMADAGLIVLAAFISPFRSERQMARGLLPPGEFLEIFIDTPIAVAEARDPKGLYRKARKGELTNFTGIDSPYEPPENAEIRISGATISAEEAAERIVEEMRRRGL